MPEAPETYDVRKNVFGKQQVHYICPTCRTRLNSPLSEAGSSDACPSCGAAFIVPGGAEREAMLQAKKQRRMTATAKRGERTAEPEPEKSGDVVVAAVGEVRRAGMRPAAAEPPPRQVVYVPQHPAGVQQNVQVIVQHRRTGSSTGVAAIVLGAISLMFCWIPIINLVALPLALVGLLLALTGLLVSILRGGAGLGFVIAGGLLCSVSIAVVVITNGLLAALASGHA